MSRHPARPVSRGSVSLARTWLGVGRRLPDIEVAARTMWLAQLYVEMWRCDHSWVRFECAWDHLRAAEGALRVVVGCRSVRTHAARLRRRVRVMLQELRRDLRGLAGAFADWTPRGCA